MGGQFFTSWQLWQQMTFVLMGAILIVFTAGLIRLRLNNRSLRHHEILDEEKRIRVETLRKTGVFKSKGPEIPFGVRAIQSGIEVDGIWISGRNTPVGSDAGSIRAPISPTSDVDMSESRIHSNNPLARLRPSSANNSRFTGATPSSPTTAAFNTAPLDSATDRSDYFGRSDYEADTLRQLEGASASCATPSKRQPLSPSRPQPLLTPIRSGQPTNLHIPRRTVQAPLRDVHKSLASNTPPASLGLTSFFIDDDSPTAAGSSSYFAAQSPARVYQPSQGSLSRPTR